ncbi:T9SS type A sorting domain-containing protein [Hymenobacter sp. GOD-10R]|uniref:T9SS type A sorting domain-containing protein n=1 Tax=Hymenobacter sp. GOD-10R TaxID=3093922 RepID=UPI002D796703|nr:T9SS type A sorting domain-containing protein [Hymenobacter sp. GOD-10R]WRQ29055.1 T9SS type A sorting domain-containing protein [Hymenobacter sp. GOD-10R]
MTRPDRFYLVTLRHLICLSVFLFCTYKTVAQNPDVIYATKVVSVDERKCGVILCSDGFENSAALATLDKSDYTTLYPSAVGSATKVRVQLASIVPAGSRAGFVVSNNKGLIDLSVLNGFIVRTYDLGGSGSSAVKQYINNSGLVRAQAFSSDPSRMEFIASQPFQEMEIEFAGLLTVATQFRLYYAFGFRDNNSTLQYKGVLTKIAAPLSTDYSTQSRNSSLVEACVNSGVLNPERAVDNTLDNYATFGSLAGVTCPATLNTRLASPAGANYQAGFVVGNGGLLDLNVLKSLKVTTYLGNVALESSLSGNLLEVNVLPDGKYQISFPATKPFDRVELQQTDLVKALSNLNVYYGFGIEQRAFRDDTPVLSNFTDPTGKYVAQSSSVLCVNCDPKDVTNPSLAADNSSDSYAQINSFLNVGGTTSLKLKLNDQYASGKAGNRAGMVLNYGGGLLNDDLLKNITLKTYAGADGSKLVETASGASLLDLGLLNNGKSEVSFLTTQDFDWVEIQVSNVVSLTERTRIYQAFAEDARIGFPTNLVAPVAPLPVELLSFKGKMVGSAVQLTWKTASERGNDYFVVERATTANATFGSIGRVDGVGSSNNEQAYSFRDTEVASTNTTSYYRLRQVDVDGRETLSPVVAIVWGKVPASTKIDLYPNPATTSQLVQLQLPVAHEQGQVLVVYNANGQSIKQYPVVANAFTVSTNNLSAGLYHIVLLDAAGQHLASQRLMVTGN